MPLNTNTIWYPCEAFLDKNPVEEYPNHTWVPAETTVGNDHDKGYSATIFPLPNGTYRVHIQHDDPQDEEACIVDRNYQVLTLSDAKRTAEEYLNDI